MAALIPAVQANAQYKATGDDGITASPRVRAQLEELKRTALAATAFPSAGIAGGTARTPNNGIAASPKLRELMREWPAQLRIEIAPIVPAK